MADIKGKRSHDIGMVRKQFGLLLEAQKESYKQLRIAGADAPCEPFFRRILVPPRPKQILQ